MNAQPGNSLPAQLLRAISLDNERLFLVVLLAAIAPLWIGPYLPLVDLPQHAAQVAALRQVWSEDPAVADLYRVNWFTPYLLGYSVLYVFALALPITAATQLMASLAIAAIPLLTGKLLRAAGADERWKWLSIPCSFGFAFFWGFLPFFVAAPLVLAFLVATIRFVAEPTLRRAGGIALFSIALFFCHVIVLGFASLVSLGWILGSHYRDARALLLRALPYAVPLPLIAVWLVVTYQTEARVQSDPIVFGPWSYRLLQLLIQPAGREDLRASMLPLVLVVDAAIVLLPWLSGARLTRQPARWMPLVFTAVVMLGAPHYVLSTAYFYQRLGLFVVPFWLLVWDKPLRSRPLERLAILAVVLWVAVNAGRFASFARETQTFAAVLDHTEPGRRVAAMVYDSGSPLFAVPVYMHFPAWYQATRGGVVDFNFADFYSSVVRYNRPDAPPRISENVSWYPTTFDWNANGGARYDYFVVKSNVDIAVDIFKDKLGSVQLAAHEGWWWLYRNVDRGHVSR